MGGTTGTQLVLHLSRFRRELLPVLPSGWRSASVVWSEIGGWELPAHVEVTGGDAGRRVSLPRSVNDSARGIRDAFGALGDPGTGRPISITLLISSDREVVDVKTNWDERVLVDERGDDGSELPADRVWPKPEHWSRELAEHPRSDANVPFWWRALLIEAQRTLAAAPAAAPQEQAPPHGAPSWQGQQPWHGQQPWQGQPWQGQPWQGQPWQGQPWQGQPWQGQPGQGQPGHGPTGGQPDQVQPWQGQWGPGEEQPYGTVPGAGPWGQMPWGASQPGGRPEHAQAAGQWGPPGAAGPWAPQQDASQGWNGHGQQSPGQSGWNGQGNDLAQPSPQQWGPHGPGQWMQPPWGGPPQWVPFATTPAAGGPQAGPGGSSGPGVPVRGPGAIGAHGSADDGRTAEDQQFGHDGGPGATGGAAFADSAESSARSWDANAAPDASPTAAIADAQTVEPVDAPPVPRVRETDSTPSATSAPVDEPDEEATEAQEPWTADEPVAVSEFVVDETDAFASMSPTQPRSPNASVNVPPSGAERGEWALPAEEGQPRTRAEARRKATRYGAEPHRFTTTTGSGQRIELSRYAEAAFAQTGALPIVPPAEATPRADIVEPSEPTGVDAAAEDAGVRPASDDPAGRAADRSVGGPGERAPVRALRAVEMLPTDAPFAAESVTSGTTGTAGVAAAPDAHVDVEPRASSGAPGLTLSNRFTPLQFDPVARLLVPALVAAVQYDARTPGTDHHDELVGRRGPAAQHQAQRDLARRAVESVRGDVDGLHVGRARDFVRAFDECVGRPHGPAVTEVSSDDARIVGRAADGDARVTTVRAATSGVLEVIAEDLVVRRFGRVANAG